MRAPMRDNVADAASLYYTHIFLARITKREWLMLMRKQVQVSWHPRMSSKQPELLKISLHLFFVVPMIKEVHDTSSA